MTKANQDWFLAYSDHELISRSIRGRRRRIHDLELRLNDALLYQARNWTGDFDVVSRISQADNAPLLLTGSMTEIEQNNGAKAGKAHKPFCAIPVQTHFAQRGWVPPDERRRQEDAYLLAHEMSVDRIPNILAEGQDFPSCYYCQHAMRVIGEATIPYRYVHIEEDIPNGCAVAERGFECPNCGWWALEAEGQHEYANGGDGDGSDYSNHYRLICGVARKFPLSASEVPVAELRRWITKHPDHVALVDPFVFEEIIADCFKDHFPNSQVTRVGGRKDRGIDIHIIHNDDEQILVQIKRRSNLLSTESVTVVRELNGVLFRERIPKGIVVTTAKTFSPAAKEEIARAAAMNRDSSHFERYDVELFDHQAVIELLNLRSQRRPAPWAGPYASRGALPEDEVMGSVPSRVG
ncbi:restriction endonuclease [Bradyrhizobium prioriisuperbiae]|uniref:restriction endonuclease n=1 Tax=Bradyrhizobium prioriisuperbiae TaxID=2854389 RepID=UPI0028E52662|nr:restriction endonuclease [Bradyrhizobium prioritasuperba]